MSRNKSLGNLSGALLVIIPVVLLVAPAAWAQSKYKTLHRFTGGADGSSPFADLIFDQAGNLYGTATRGKRGGTVFKLMPNANGGWAETVLHTFAGGTDGSESDGGLIFDAAGNLYGTTVDGGAFESGHIFELSPNADGSWTETVLYSFTGGADGSDPKVGLIFDAEGNLYGTTWFGGRFSCETGCGVVFELTPNGHGSWTEKVLYSFHRSGAPYGRLTLDKAGNLYGTALGVVFKLTPNAKGTWTFSVLHGFTGGRGGLGPHGALVFDQSGNLYGTTQARGNVSRCIGGCGVVYELIPGTNGSWTEHVLHTFHGPDGSNPVAGVIFDAAGNLYGTTWLGGKEACNCGTAFRLTPNSEGQWSETVLWRFAGTPGYYPFASLILDAAGNLYGTTFGNGNTTLGSVFEITP